MFVPVGVLEFDEDFFACVGCVGVGGWVYMNETVPIKINNCMASLSNIYAPFFISEFNVTYCAKEIKSKYAGCINSPCFTVKGGYSLT